MMTSCIQLLSGSALDRRQCTRGDGGLGEGRRWRGRSRRNAVTRTELDMATIGEDNLLGAAPCGRLDLSDRCFHTGPGRPERRPRPPPLIARPPASGSTSDPPPLPMCPLHGNGPAIVLLIDRQKMIISLATCQSWTSNA